MALNPLSEYVSGIKSIAFKLFGKKTDDSYEAIKTNDNGALKVDGVVTLSGSSMELYGTTIAGRPLANTVEIGTTFTIVDNTQEFNTWMSDGTTWGEEL